MRARDMAFAAATAAAALSVTAPAGARMTFRDLAEMRVPSGIALAPDGKRFVFATTSADFDENETRSRIWYFDPGGPKVRQRVQKLLGFREEIDRPRARPLTGRDGRPGSPAFTPDGRQVSFLATRGEDAREQVWTLPLAGGEAESWTESETDVERYAWAPDGSLIFLAEDPRPAPIQEYRDEREKAGDDVRRMDRDRRPKALWLVPPSGGEARRLHTDPGIDDFALSFDGARIAFTSNGTGLETDWKKADLWTFDVPDGPARRITTRGGEEWSPRWSEDGQTVYFLSGVDTTRSYSQVKIWGIPADGGEWTLVSGELDRDVLELVTCEDSDRVYAVVEDGTNKHVYRFIPGSWRAEQLTDEPGRVTGLAMKKNGETAVFVREGPSTAPEVATWTFPDDYVEVRTALNEAVTAKAAAERRIVRWSAPDGTEIEGLLVLPADRDGVRPLPTLVYCHGGPFDHVTNALSRGDSEAIAARGYAFFAPNFRGSSGYNESFGVANFRDLGGADFADVMAGVDRLIRDGIADPDRLGIFGGSYGGFLTNRAVTSTDRFAAAVSRYGIASFVTDFANSDISEWEWDYFHAYFWEDPDIYQQLSPLRDVARIKTPLLLQHGADDSNTTIANSRELYTSLRTLGATVELDVYPREGHGFDEPLHYLDSRRRMMRWFDRWLLEDDAGSVGVPVAADGWSLLVRSAEKVDDIGGIRSADGFLVVDFVLTSETAVRDRPFALTGEDAAFTLTDPDGRPLPPVGLPVGAGGGDLLIRGRQSVTLSGTPAENTASWALRVAFDLANHSPPARFQAMGLPPVRIRWDVPAPEPPAAGEDE